MAADPFEPPKSAGDDPNYAALVSARAFRALGPDVQLGLVYLSRREPAEVARAIAAGQPLVLAVGHDPFDADFAAVLAMQLLGVQPSRTGEVRTSWIVGFALATLLPLRGLALQAQRIAPNWNDVGIQIGMAGLCVGAILWLGPGEWVRRARARAAYRPPRAPADLEAVEAMLAADGRAFPALGALGGLILSEPRGSPRRVAALRRAAELRAQTPAVAMTAQLKGRADGEASMLTARGAPPPPPWRDGARVVISMRLPGRWPDRCVRCGGPGVALRTFVLPSRPGAGWLDRLGATLAVAIAPSQMGGTAISVSPWLCAAHTPSVLPAVARGVSALVVVLLSLALAVMLGTSVVVLVGVAFASVLANAPSDAPVTVVAARDGHVWLGGADPGFVAALPERPGPEVPNGPIAPRSLSP